MQRATSGARAERHASVAALTREVERELDGQGARQRTRRLLGLAALAARGGFLAGLLAG